MASKYKPIGISCTHCGEELAARWEPVFDGFVIKGLEPHSLVHARDGMRTCTIIRNATAYDAWKAVAALKEVESREHTGE